VIVGDGLFAKADIPQGSLVAYYSGAHLHDYNTIIFPNMTAVRRGKKSTFAIIRVNTETPPGNNPRH
jgi:hypothetical protein